jgi:phosphonate transport system substrate-binding protein
MRFFVSILILFAFVACTRKPGEVKVLNLNDTSTSRYTIPADTSYRPLKVAVSAILSPKETFESYEDIFRYISDELGLPVEFHQRKTYAEINRMLEAGQLDFAFICSGAYIELNPYSGVELLAVPISKGKPYYKAYIIVPENSDAQSLLDLRNKTFAYTDPMSNSGYLYARYRLIQEGKDVENFFDNAVFTYGHDISMQMVAKGIVDGATVDHLVYEYLKEKQPQRVQGIRVIEQSEDFGIPPVVVSPRLDGEMREKVKELFLQMHTDPKASVLIHDLLIDKFISGNDADYNSIREMKSVFKNQPNAGSTIKR